MNFASEKTIGEERRLSLRHGEEVKMPARMSTATKATAVAMLSIGLLFVCIGLLIGSFTSEAAILLLVGTILLCATAVFFGPMALVHPYYHKYGAGHWSELQKTKRDRQTLERATRAYTKKYPIESAVERMNDLIAEPDRTLPRGVVIVASYCDYRLGVQTVSFEKVSRKIEFPPTDGPEDLYLDPSKCASAKVVVGTLSLPVTVEADDFVTDTRIFMNLEDMRELGVSRHDTLELELYFGHATSAMMRDAETVDWVKELEHGQFQTKSDQE